MTVEPAPVSNVVEAPAAVTWLENYTAALETAKKENKPILVDFSGTDWCMWCIKLDEEVFSKPEFKEYAAKNLVLLLVDFPKSKSMSDEQKKANKELAEKFGVEGYPTVLLLDSEGKLVATTGYQEGGAQKYIEHLQALLAVKKEEPPAATQEPPKIE